MIDKRWRHKRGDWGERRTIPPRGSRKTLQSILFTSASIWFSKNCDAEQWEWQWFVAEPNKKKKNRIYWSLAKKWSKKNECFGSWSRPSSSPIGISSPAFPERTPSFSFLRKLHHHWFPSSLLIVKVLSRWEWVRGIRKLHPPRETPRTIVSRWPRSASASTATLSSQPFQTTKLPPRNSPATGGWLSTGIRRTVRTRRIGFRVDYI